MAVTFNGGVVLGADSRTSTGSYIANRYRILTHFLLGTILPGTILTTSLRFW